MTQCRTHQVEPSYLRKNSIMLLRLFVKVNPIVINIWIMFMSIGHLLNIDISGMSSLRYELGNSLIHCFIYLSGAYVFRLCMWHKLLVFSMISNCILLRLQIYGLVIYYNLYTSITITTLALIYAAIANYYGLCRKKKDNSNA